MSIDFSGGPWYEFVDRGHRIHYVRDLTCFGDEPMPPDLGPRHHDSPSH